MDLKNKVALVTGAGVRLGQSIALKLAQLGMRVIIHYHRSDKGAKQTAKFHERPKKARISKNVPTKKFSELGLLGVEIVSGPRGSLLPTIRASQRPYKAKSEKCSKL